MIDIKLNYKLKCGYKVVGLKKFEDQIHVTYRKGRAGTPIMTCWVGENGIGEDDNYSLVVDLVRVTRFFFAARSDDGGFWISEPFDTKKEAEEEAEEIADFIKVFSKSFEL